MSTRSPPGKVGLQSLGLDAGLGQLLRCPAGRRKAFHAVAVSLGTLANNGERSRLPCSRYTIQPDDLLMRPEHLLDGLPLSLVQLRMLVSRLLGRTPPYKARRPVRCG